MIVQEPAANGGLERNHPFRRHPCPPTVCINAGKLEVRPPWLQHTFGVEAALAGCSDAQGGALMGHSIPNSFATNRRQAARLALSDDGAALVTALRERVAGTPAERDVSNDCPNVSKALRPSPGCAAESPAASAFCDGTASLA